MASTIKSIRCPEATTLYCSSGCYAHWHRPQLTGLWLLTKQLPALCSPLAVRKFNCAKAAVNTEDFELIEERGIQFTPGSAFYRAESAQGRDLAVLAAAVHKQQHGTLRVLDVMAGSGMRGARYLSQAGADLVWCNDHDTRNNAALVYNLVHALEQQQHQQTSQQQFNSSSCRSSGSVKDQASQWSSEAEVIAYEGIRGNVQQWTSSHNNDSSSSSSSSDDKSRIRSPHAVPPHAHQHQQQQQQQEQQQQSLCIAEQQQQSLCNVEQQQQQQQQQQCRVSHVDARRLLCSTFLSEDYYDLVDVDSFGSDTSWLAAAVAAVKYGGMLYITSTDGFCSGGKRPQRSLAAYGSYLRALPHANEQGLRMLIGAAVREAAAQGVALTPLFSLYSYHGPVFRVMLRVERSSEGLGAQMDQWGFVGHCFVHGEYRRVHWRGLSQAWCRCKPAQPSSSSLDDDSVGGKASPTPLVLSGPMWTGPLHDQEFVAAMSAQAAAWGWQGSAVAPDSPYLVRQSKNNKQRPLEVLLDVLHQEAAPQLPPWYTCIATLAQHLNTTPSRDKLISALRARGYIACLCHVENRALRTNATTQQVLQVAVENCGYKYRQQPTTPSTFLQQHDVELDQHHQTGSSMSCAEGTFADASAVA